MLLYIGLALVLMIAITLAVYAYKLHTSKMEHIYEVDKGRALNDKGMPIDQRKPIVTL